MGQYDIDVEGTREIINSAGSSPRSWKWNRIRPSPQWGCPQLPTEGMVAGVGTLGHALQPRLLDNPLIVLEHADRLGETPAQVLFAWGIQRGSAVLTSSVTPARIAEARGRHRASRRRRPADQRAGDTAPVQLRRRRRRTGIPRSASRQLT